MPKMIVTGEFQVLVSSTMTPEEIDHEAAKCLHQAVSFLRGRRKLRVLKAGERIYSGHVVKP